MVPPHSTGLLGAAISRPPRWGADMEARSEVIHRHRHSDPP